MPVSFGESGILRCRQHHRYVPYPFFSSCFFLERCCAVRLIMFFLIFSIQAAQQQIMNVLKDKEEE